MITLYGIKNCDTVKKAQRWLNEHQITYQFHDFRADGLASDQVEQWLQVLGGAKLINKRSTTWKQLSAEQRELAQSEDVRAVGALLAAHPTLIKRPVLVEGDQVQNGFSDAEFALRFGRG